MAQGIKITDAESRRKAKEVLAAEEAMKVMRRGEAGQGQGRVCVRVQADWGRCAAGPATPAAGVRCAPHRTSPLATNPPSIVPPPPPKQELMMDMDGGEGEGQQQQQQGGGAAGTAEVQMKEGRKPALGRPRASSGTKVSIKAGKKAAKKGGKAAKMDTE